MEAVNPIIIYSLILTTLVVIIVAVIVAKNIKSRRLAKKYERALKMVPLLIHLPPATDDIEVGSRDERDVVNETIAQAQVMYSILTSTLVKGKKSRIYGQKHFSLEMISREGRIKYYAVVPAVLTETVKQAIVSAYPAARVEERQEENLFSKEGKNQGVAGGELNLKKEFFYPLATYEETKWDASAAILNALSVTKQDEGMALQVLFRPTDQSWIKEATDWVQKIKEGKKKKKSGRGLSKFFNGLADLMVDILEALWRPPEQREKEKEKPKEISTAEQAEMQAIESKTRFPGFEVAIRVIASSSNKPRSEAMVGGLVAAFSQFESTTNNGFEYKIINDGKKLARDYIFREFTENKKKRNVLNSVEMATIFHLPAQNAIPNSQVERQLTRQVDGPVNLVDEGVLLGVNQFRGEEKQIRLSENDRRRHTYVIGATGMGKSVFLGNLAYQDMMDGRGFAFIDPHGDVVEDILSKVPPERIDDVIYFDPGDLERPMGMNMFEWTSEDQKDFIVQEGINMLYSLYDPGHTGIFGPRGEHMFRNAALLLMSDPKGATFVDIPRVFIDPEFVREKLQYVTDRNVYDYWTKEFPASQKSNDAGEVTTWFVSKWGPFLSNTMMRNVLGQVKSGFSIREVMDQKKILLVNLSKGRLGELNSKLLGMIFVMKFQTAAMSRVDTPEEKREDFCLFVDEFQNFSTESFESILSEARKFRLNLVVANQFMTQLSDKIREGVLGNVGTFIAGRVGVTDAELLEKVFRPTFNAEDLHKQPNYHALATVMMHGMPTSPFTMKLLPPLGEKNLEVMDSLKSYSAVKYGKTRVEVEREIEQRMRAVEKSKEDGGRNFLENWLKKQGE